MAWNVFKLCTALKALGSIMIVAVLGVVAITYYAVVFLAYGPSLFLGGADSSLSFLVLLIFHFLLAMLLWCYFSTIVTDPGGVPPDWRPSIDEETGESVPLAAPAPSVSDSRPRFCRKCNQFKPHRCHHCSVCGRCILKMDHHCVWVVNCVGARNYKFFLLFLFYTFLETSIVSVSLLGRFLEFLNDREVSGSPVSLLITFIAFVLNLSFALSLLGFLIMHANLVLSNTTTIEIYEKRKNPNSRWVYDLGKTRNFEQMSSVRRYFGELTSPYTWTNQKQVHFMICILNTY